MHWFCQCRAGHTGTCSFGLAEQKVLKSLIGITEVKSLDSDEASAGPPYWFSQTLRKSLRAPRHLLQSGG